MNVAWLESALEQRACDETDLARVGVLSQHLSTDPAQFEPALAALRQAHHYVARDEVQLTADTPNLTGLLDKFKDEHLHDEDEVRFVLRGSGIFDVRSADDRWMRITVEAGDLLVVPKGLYHRFFLTECCEIRCVRLFQDTAGWTPHYRQPRAA